MSEESKKTYNDNEEAMPTAEEEIQKSPEDFDTKELDGMPIFAATDEITSQKADAVDDKKEPSTTNWKKELRDWVAAIAIAVALALIIRNFVFTLVKVQGQSMEPTLQNSDRLYVNRFLYNPEKGDVIIFVPESDPEHPYVKRVIATEGDSVYIDFKTGEVFVNGQLIEEPYIKEKTRLSGSYIMSLVAQGNYGPDTPIVIQEGHVFAMGDNRNNSKDSREIGQVPVDEILGGAVFRFWPLDNIGGLHMDAISTSLISEGSQYAL